jgi:peptide deformylase
MALLPILQYPDPRLRTRAAPVRSFDAALSRLVDDMFETMYAARAIGLAATQVDVHRQVVTIDVSGSGAAPEVFINPQILAQRRPALVEESCLSVPGVLERVRRSTVLRVRSHDRAGRVQERELADMLAVCLGHEIDHLAGRLFVDRLSVFKRLRVRARARIAQSRSRNAPAHGASGVAGRA